jgi:DUF2934 family protein
VIDARPVWVNRLAKAFAGLVEAEAYALFLSRGAQHGHDVEDWLAAEALVRARHEEARRREES